MKTDGYTKTVLTIIAGALVYLCWVKQPEAVQAQSGVQSVRIVDVQTADPVRVATYHQESVPAGRDENGNKIFNSVWVLNAYPVPTSTAK